VLRGLDLAARLVAAAMFAAVFVIFCAKIVLRYAEHISMAWADEVCVILFIWIVFWANAFILRERDHIRFDLLYRAFGPRGQRVLAVLRALLIGGIFAAALPTTIDYIAFLWRERTPVLEWRLDRVYACFGLFAATVVLRCAYDLVRLLGRGWRSQI
jgi:TRAP-type C4-dicarboxylate transport system permease small subunit